MASNVISEDQYLLVKKEKKWFLSKFSEFGKAWDFCQDNVILQGDV